MRLIDADALMEKLNGIWDCNDMTFEPVDGCCIDADCKSCRWRETIEYVKRLVQNQTTASPWHRVEDELPEIGKRVLVSYGGYVQILKRTDSMTYNGRNYWWNEADGLWERVEEGAYWMPIEPPKEDA